MLILTFEDSEEEILNHIISCVNTGARVFQVIENAKTNLSSDIVRHILAFLEDGVSETREKQQRYLPLFAAYVTRLCGLQVLKNYVDYV